MRADFRFVVPFVLFVAVLWGLRAGFDYRLPYWGAIGLYLVLAAAVSRLDADARRQRKLCDATQDSAGEWPTSGPVGRLGQRGLTAIFMVSGLLALLNPFQLIQIVRQGVGNALISRRLRRTPPLDPSGYVNDVTYTLPFDGEWLVYNGGTTPATSHSWEVLTQRYAYDFVVADASLRRHTGRGTRLGDYFCHGLPIRAAAAGVVVEVRDGIGPAPFLGYGIVDVLARSVLGNYVVVEHSPREFSLYAHLETGSVAVREGHRVAARQLIGRCGHTGHSSEPHLHFHLQDRPNFFLAAGVPITFADLEVDGVDRGAIRPTVGNRVRHRGGHRHRLPDDR